MALYLSISLRVAMMIMWSCHAAILYGMYRTASPLAWPTRRGADADVYMVALADATQDCATRLPAHEGAVRPHAVHAIVSGAQHQTSFRHKATRQPRALLQGSSIR
eukprot:6193366-Pleurochrysis_carterae.AAC.3